MYYDCELRICRNYLESCYSLLLSKMLVIFLFGTVKLEILLSDEFRSMEDPDPGFGTWDGSGNLVLQVFIIFRLEICYAFVFSSKRYD